MAWGLTVISLLLDFQAPVASRTRGQAQSRASMKHVHARTNNYS